MILLETCLQNTVELTSIIDSGQIQFQVQSIHAFLKSIMPDDALCLIGLTMTDLYEEKPDLFVAGMANGNQRVAVCDIPKPPPPPLSFAMYN